MSSRWKGFCGQDLGGTYREYKTRQAKFTDWLRATAFKVASSSATTSSSSTIKPATRKNRSSRTKPPRARRLKVAAGTRGLEQLVQIVCSGSDDIDVPKEYLKMLRDVIALRKACASFYRPASSTSKNERLAKDNAAHNHMIVVLEGMLTKLEAKVASTSWTTVESQTKQGNKAQVQPARPTAQNQAEDLGTVFSRLEVFGPAEAGHSHSDGEGHAVENTHQAQGSKARRKKKKNKTSKQKQASKSHKEQPSIADDDFEWALDEEDHEPEQEEGDPFDVYMLIYCLIEDINQVRDHVVEKWCDYYYKETDIKIETLAAITNAAYELFQKMQQEFEREAAKASPDFQSYTWIIQNLLASELDEKANLKLVGFTEAVDMRDPGFGPAGFTTLCETERVSDEARKTIQEHEFSEETNLRCALRPWALMRSWFKTPRCRYYIPSLCPDHRDFSPLYGQLDAESLFNLDWYTTQDYCQDLTVLKLIKEAGRLDYLLPAEPELALAFQDALRHLGTHNSVAFIFSLQLFLDIRRTLETDVVHPFTHMIATARRVHGQLDHHLYHHAGRTSPAAALLRRRRLELDRFLLRDPLHDDADLAFDESPDRFYLHRRDPVWCGLLSLRARLVAARLGREAVARRSFVVDAAAYLYAAGRAHAEDRVPFWEAMERWMVRREAGGGGNSLFWRGLYPKGMDPVAILAGFEAYAPVFGGEGMPSVKGVVEAATARGVRKMERGALEPLWERYGDTFRWRARHLGYLDEIVGLYGQAHAEEGDAPCPGGSNHGDGCGRRYPVGMLKILEETVQSQLEGELKVDYFGLFDQSARILEHVWRSYTGKPSKLGQHGNWTEGEQVERLPWNVVRLARAGANPNKRQDVLNCLGQVLGPAIQWYLPKDGGGRDYDGDDYKDGGGDKGGGNGGGGDNKDGGGGGDDSDGDDCDEAPEDYSPHYQGCLGKESFVVIKKKGPWSAGWADDQVQASLHVGPGGSMDKIWSTHELSEHFDSFQACQTAGRLNRGK